MRCNVSGAYTHSSSPCHCLYGCLFQHPGSEKYCLSYEGNDKSNLKRQVLMDVTFINAYKHWKGKLFLVGSMEPCWSLTHTITSCSVPPFLDYSVHNPNSFPLMIPSFLTQPPLLVLHFLLFQPSSVIFPLGSLFALLTPPALPAVHLMEIGLHRWISGTLVQTWCWWQAITKRQNSLMDFYRCLSPVDLTVLLHDKGSASGTTVRKKSKCSNFIQIKWFLKKIQSII